MDLQELKSNNQNRLFNYDSLFLNFVNLYKKNKLPNKIYFSGPKGIGKSTFAYHLINYIFSIDEEFIYDLEKMEINSSNKSYKLVSTNSHPNFYLIDVFDDKKVIEISQIREMINYANKSSFNNKEKIILIDNAENLNTNSSNALLKMIEEPNNKVFFILILDNSKKISETLKSRCIKFNFFLDFDQCLDTTNKIINKSVFECINKDLINHYDKIGDFINLINFSQVNNIDIYDVSLKKFLINLINEQYYKKNDFIKISIYKFIENYFFKIISVNKQKTSNAGKYENFINKIHNLKKFNLDQESFFIECKSVITNE